MEFNFDGLVGPTHNYAGLSYGNVASKSNKGKTANPKQAALQGLKKMKALYDLGIPQGVLPPQERPNIQYLKSMGFNADSEAEIIKKAYKADPILVAIATSASSMWTANAATVSPSADTQDNKVHFTVANLYANAHRAQEYKTTYKILQSIFDNPKHFHVHQALMGGDSFADEGAANHTRLCDEFESQGLELFVYGRSALDPLKPKPSKFPARQTLEACQAIARRHQLHPDKTFFIQQNPEVINQGVFHNDVISVGTKNLLFAHDQAFVDQQKVCADLKQKMPTLNILEVSSEEVSVEDAIKSYLFNTQLISTNGKMVLIAPEECRDTKSVHTLLSDYEQNSEIPIDKVHYFDLRESMQNGGGPACLRLRVVLNEQEQQAVNKNCLMSDKLYLQLTDWVNKHYRDHIEPNDIQDPELLNECRMALDELTQILKLGSIYDFQMN